MNEKKCLLILLLCAQSTVYGLSKPQDSSQKANQTPQKIIALAPHLAQLAHSAGVGHTLVAVSEYTPVAYSANLPKIGNAFNVNWGLLAELKPTLVLIWGSGTSLTVKSRLKALKIPTFESEPSTLEGIVQEAHKLSVQMGVDTQSNTDLMSLKQRYQAVKHFNVLNQKAGNLIPTFHPVWHKPLMTVNGRHVLTDAMRYCGMKNIFSNAKGLTPTVSLPQVLREQPKIILMTTSNSNDVMDTNSPWYGLMHAFPAQAAFKPMVIAVNGERFHQPGPSLIDETLALCKAVSELKNKK